MIIHFLIYYTRQHICYSAYMPRQFRLSVYPSVCPSVTRVLCGKTAERIIEILSLSDRPIILVFHHQGLFHRRKHRGEGRGGRVPPESIVRGTPMLFVPPDFDHLRREKRQNLVPKYTKIHFFGALPRTPLGELTALPRPSS